MRRKRILGLTAVIFSLVSLAIPFLSAEGVPAMAQTSGFPDCTNPKQNRVLKPFDTAARARVEQGVGSQRIVIIRLLQSLHFFVTSPPDAQQRGDTPYVHFVNVKNGFIDECAVLNGTEKEAKFFFVPSGSGPPRVRYQIYYTKFNDDGTKVRKLAENSMGFAFAPTAGEAESLAMQEAYDEALAAGFLISEIANTVISSLQPDGQFFAVAQVPNLRNEADQVDPDGGGIIQPLP